MNVRKFVWLAVFLMAASISPSLAPGALAQESILVGRIAFTEGQILRYVPDTQDWVATVKDAPFGMDDALYSDASARAEFIMPNGLWVRIGPSTQIQLIALKPDASEMDLGSGVARFYNKNSNGMLKVTTPFGYVLAEPNSSFDLYVGDQSAEVIAFSGGVDFIHKDSNAKYNVAPGGGSVLADAAQVGSGDGTVDAEWDDWNAGRDSLWTKRTQVKGDSTRYIPPQIQDDAYALEENGKWEKVYYEGEYRQLWRPTTVASSWRPFSVGRWTEWYGDQCWVPDEPFGYVTHHYGNWVLVNGGWFWMPPAPRVVVAAGPVVGFGWYPGRVAWIHSEADVGWVPLAPTEVYYTHHHWGPRAVVITGAPAVAVSLASLAFAPAAVIVPQASFYSVRSYSGVAVVNVNRTTIINNYRTSPVVNQTVIRNYDTVNRHNFTNVAVTQKPHAEVVTRIRANQHQATTAAQTVTAASLRHNAQTLKPAEAPRQAQVPQPKFTNKIVPANQVNAPKNQVNFKPVDVKKNAKPATASPAVKAGPGGPIPQPGVQPAMPGAPGATAPGQHQRPGQPPAPGATQPGAPGIQPPRPGQPTAPGAVTPGQPPKPGQPAAPGTTQPGAPGIRPPRPGHPATPEAVTPGQPPKPGQPAVPGTTQPGAPGIRPPRPGHPATPEAVTPGQPPRPGRPGAPGTTQPGTPGIQPPRPGRPSAPGTTQPAAPEMKQPRPGSRPLEPAGPGVRPAQPERGPRPGLQAPGRQQPETRQPSAPPTTQPKHQPSPTMQPRPVPQQQLQPRHQQPPATQPRPAPQPQLQPRPAPQPQLQPRHQQPPAMQPPRPQQPPQPQPPQQQQQKKKKPGELPPQQ